MDINLEYSNKILDRMIKRAKNRKIKRSLINSDLNIKWHNMNGNYNDCYVTLYCLEDDYYEIKNEKNTIEKLLCDCIPSDDLISIIDFKLKIIFKEEIVEVDNEIIINYIYKIKRYLKYGMYTELFELFETLVHQYGKTINELNNTSPLYFKDEKDQIVEDKVKEHALYVIELLNKYLSLISTNYQINQNVQNDEKTLTEEYDVFISHAYLDKAENVDKPKESIIKLGVKIFYDSSELSLGDKWKEKILDAIKKSRFAIFDISKNFFNREWTEKQLRLFSEIQSVKNRKIILPILYDVTKSEVEERYPNLVDIQYINGNDKSIDEITIYFASLLIGELKNN